MRRSAGGPYPGGVTARILLVDDNATLIENFREILEGSAALGARVSTAMDGRSAVRLAREVGFDVALVDVKLPDGSGVDVVRALRDTCPQGEVVLITGFATVDSAVAALKAGAFAFLLKSFRPEELLSTVEQAFAKVQLKQEREELQRRQRALIETAGVLIVAVDGEDRLALHNPKVAEMTAEGIPAAEGRPILESWVSEDSRERVASALKRAREGHPSVEVEAGFSDGSDRNPPRRIHWYLSAVRGSDDQPGLVYGIGVDVTERRALEKRAAEAEALSTMGALALGLAHEIRNPLNAASLHVTLLERALKQIATPPPVAVEASGVLRSEIQRLSSLVNEFLDFARPKPLRLTEYILCDLCTSVLELLRPDAESANVKIQFSPPRRQIWVKIDGERFRQVLINLLRNAIEATADNAEPRVTLRVRRAASWAEIDIEDNGKGIADGTPIFDAFYTSKETGTGLGLSIVHRIIDDHGGSISYRSVPGETVFTVRLPGAFFVNDD